VGEEDIDVKEEGETLGESTRIQACKCPDLKSFESPEAIDVL
jgi:hypothetical protein